MKKILRIIIKGGQRRSQMLYRLFDEKRLNP
jgi:hypothetical protein